MADTLYGPRHLAAGFEVAANNEVGAVAFGPFNVGERVDFVEVMTAWVPGAATVAASVHNVFVDFRFTSKMPATVTEALKGKALFPEVSGTNNCRPRVTAGVGELSAAGFFPVEWIATQQERFLIVLLSTDDADEGFSACVCAFKARRMLP